MQSALGLLSAQSIRQIQALDATIHNISNVDTPGFKSVLLSFLPDNASHWGGKVPTTERETTQFFQGPTIGTGNPLDMAIEGEGFFVIETPDGLAYTRDGRFSLNPQGELVNLSGFPVMGDGGVIILDGDHLTVDQTGALRVDNVPVDTLRIAHFENPQALTRADAGLFFDRQGNAGERDDRESRVQGHTLEQSNVAAIEEMVRMIEINRIFESYQKVMQTIQELNQLATSRVGRV